MAVKQQGADLDFLKVGIVKDVRLNPLSASARATLAGTLGASHVGLVTTDDVTAVVYAWDGTQFVAPSFQSGLTPKGSRAFNATEPASPAVGDLYVFSSAGANTWEGTNDVEIGDQAWWDGTAWQFIEGMVVQATETVQGVAEIATQDEVNTGTDDTRIVTPLKLKTYISNIGATRSYFVTGVSLTANTPLTINHALALQHRDAFTLSFKVSNSEFGVDVDSIDINNCSVTSNVAVTGNVFVTGF